MNLFEFVILLVVVVLVYQLWELRLKNKQTAAAAADEDNRHARLDDLERRIEVLERIVTDSKFDLNRQLHDLEQGGLDQR